MLVVGGRLRSEALCQQSSGMDKATGVVRLGNRKVASVLLHPEITMITTFSTCFDHSFVVLYSRDREQ